MEAQPATPAGSRANFSLSSPLFIFCFFILTFNYIAAIRRATGDIWNITFIVSTYSLLVLLFYCLHAYERFSNGLKKKKKKRYTAFIWSLGAMLNFMFAYKVSTVMPWEMSLGVWVMASLSIVATYYALFIYKEDDTN
ncbi:hypothetical protein QJS10_CPB22g00780 [Acorus calamus]|uniref:Uncharacterized protein n=1 Tax=Acorus calamus TaxID=4465 RepID=A0AAV9C266_ACOCL|nr:hypothetical protein QJS10_CPB22g00780 [Acorus calamus]